MCRCEDFPCCGHDEDRQERYYADVEYVENIDPSELASPYYGNDQSDPDFWDDGPDTDLLNEI